MNEAGLRVLMLVDNGIDGDSRVQKAARSMAAAGHQVTLLGRSPEGTHDRWMLGQAEIRRVPVDFARERRQRRLLGPAVRLLGRRSGSRRPAPPSSPASPAGQARPGSAGSAGSLATRLDGWRALAWRRLRGDSCWQWLEPRLLDYEAAFWPVIESYRPQILHAHDYKMIGVASRAAERLRARGDQVRVLYDAHEYLPGVGGPTLRWRIAHEAYERQHLPRMDAVVAVSPTMARQIQQTHHLPVTPSVVMNAPPMATAEHTDCGDLRSALAVGPSTPLLVYVGACAAKRGLEVAVRGLAELPGVHLALLTKPNHYLDQLLALAGELGLADRLLVHDYVPVDDVVPFISTADAGLQSMLRLPNYEVTIATKYFDYAQARLPIVVSDVAAMAELTRTIGNGAVYRADDPASFAATVAHVLDNAARYRAAYDRPGLLDHWTWEAQAQTLAQVYQRLVVTPPGSPVTPVATVGA